MSIFKDLQIPLDAIVTATNEFSDENVIEEGAIYKGQLLYSGELTDIIVRRFDPNKYGQGDIEFLTEILMLSSLNHQNLVSFIGFCDERGEKIIIHKYDSYKVNSSLDIYLSDPTLTWIQRLKICVGVARALSYIYFDAGRDFSVIHRDIKSSKILLDENWEPKLSGFEHSIKSPAARRHRLLLAEPCGTYGYLDPAIEITGGVTHKSDIYSLGVVLFEVLCGRRVFVPGENEDELLSQLAKSRYEEGKLDDIMVNPDQRNQMDPQSYKIFSDTAYECLNVTRAERPDIDQVLQRLEKALGLQQQYEHKRSTRTAEVEQDTSDYRPQFFSYYPPPSFEGPYRPNPSSTFHEGQPPSSVSRFNYPNHSSVFPVNQPPSSVSRFNYPNHSSVFPVNQPPSSVSRFNYPNHSSVFPVNQPPSSVSRFNYPNHSSVFHVNQENGNIMSFSLHGYTHLQIPLEDISSATSNFADENIIGQCGAGKLYKGQLSSSGLRSFGIVARRLEGQEDHIELCREMSMLSSLRHENLATVFGFCDENGEKIIIYNEHSVHGCLDKYLNDHATLTWSQRLKICLGVARALDYIHYDAIHCGISSSKILIDEDGEPKIFGFGISTRYPGNWMHRLLVSHNNETSQVRMTPKYDVYSFGLLLYDVLSGGKPMSIDNGIVKKKLDEMIDPDLGKQMSTQSLNNLSKLADNCLNQESAKRPTMDEIVKELENMLKQPENLEHSALADIATPSDNLTKENMERLKILLSDIKKATSDFSNASCIGSGGYGKVYKADLEHLDIQNIPDWKNKEQVPKKLSTVAIKRIFNIQGEEGFLAELEILTSCNHRNIVSLLGFSCEDREMILVFEFAKKGSLDNCLENNKMANVTWAQRIQICLDIAHGLNYIHTNLEGKQRIVHRDVKSANILLDEKWNAKVADFGLSKFHPVNQQASTVHTMHIAGTDFYLDPEYSTSNTYKKESDLYSFGVVLFEILSGRLAYDEIYCKEGDKGLASVARQRFKKGTIKELIDSNMMEEANEHIFTVNKEPNQKSLNAFTKIAYQCLEETRVMRPKMEAIIKELEDAINFQGKSMVLAKFRLSDIVSATENFSAKHCIGVGAYGTMYNAKLNHFDRKSLSEIEGIAAHGGELPKKHTSIVALKRIFNRGDGLSKQGLFSEIDLLAGFRHPNIVSPLGVSNENNEMIIIYEYAFKGSLHDCLGKPQKMALLTWAKRIQISLDIAKGLNYLQTSTKDKQRIMQFPMNSTNILLDTKSRAKIACFWLSNSLSADKEANILNINNIVATEVQSDPEYIKIEKLKNESGIYSFGVILFEIMCGKLQYDGIYYAEKEKGLPIIARRCFEEKTILKLMIDPNLKKETQEKICVLNEEVSQDSFDAFLKIAYECCSVRQADRPSLELIIEELENALKNQVEHFEHLKTRVVEQVENLKPLIAHKDILSATKNFSKEYLIGSGGFSKVYKAKAGTVIEGKNKGDVLKRHSTVAIKRINGRQDEEGSKGFFAELQALSNCEHPNIVSLLGFCLEKDEMILVLEYASKGSLDDILRNSDIMTNLTWDKRIQICLDIARGLSYLHTIIDGKQMIHRDIKSANILLNDNLVAKIADFGLCKLNHAYQQSSNMNNNIVVGTNVYLDPEYMKTGTLKEESDIYSFGVVLFEIMCGKLAYDKMFNEGGLPPIAQKCFEDRTLEQIIDPRMSKADENNFTINGGLDQDSLNVFSKIAYQCLAERQGDRPNVKTVICELEKAYQFQKNSTNKLHISLLDIKRMTKNFSKCVGEGRGWKLYEGEKKNGDGYITIVAKRFDSKSDKQQRHFMRELEILSDCKHQNVIGLVGYCQEMNETIIVYEQASNGRLNEHLDDDSVTWMKRLKICFDVASGLHFLHRGGATKDIPIMHRDIKSASILLDGDDLIAKISNLESSLYDGEYEEIKDTFGSLAYMDPKFIQNGHSTRKSDIYSLGVVLLEMLCGRLAWVEGYEDHSRSLGPLAKQCFNKEGKLDELVFDGIKDQVDPESLDTFANIALKCLEDEEDKRPEASEVVTQLNKAVELQEDIDIWEPKLPRDYKEILHYSEIKSKTKKEIYNKQLCEGVLLRDREVCLSRGSNGEKHYMISAKKFSYGNRWAHNWRHIPQSRFENVAEMSILSNLNIKLKIRTWFLSPGVNYGVHFIFKFCDPRKTLDKSMYVNLTYKMGNQTFHAYFATWRDQEWMTVELCRFMNHKEDTNFEVLIESFSSYYCGKGAIYVEGIEFRVIHNVQHKETEKIKEVRQVLKSISNKGHQVKQLPSVSEEILKRSEEEKANKLFLLNERNGKKQLTVSAKEVLYKLSDVKHIELEPLAESRFQEVIELLAEQVLRISCKIENKMSQDTEYSCYLVFKLSEKCCGLHCPVRVRDLHRRKNKEVKNIYLRSPSPWNLHDINVPVQRDDGWMEVNVWNFNSNHKLNYDCFWVKLKLISYEGTMAGLTVGGLEFRPT